MTSGRPIPVLDKIVSHKREEVDRAKAGCPIDELSARAKDTDPPRDFVDALTTARRRDFAIIAEVKRRSPSAGLIRPEYQHDFDPLLIATAYSNAGASAISCLTDEKFFGGQTRFISRIRGGVDLPVLRKDFLIDPWQVHESRAAGADAILLIAECLDDRLMPELLDLARSLGMGVLLEAYSRTQIERTTKLITKIGHEGVLLGVNNRDLSTMTVDIGHTLNTADLVPDRSRFVSESGIRARADLDRLKQGGVSIALVGEHLMRQDDPGSALATLLGE